MKYRTIEYLRKFTLKGRCSSFWYVSTAFKGGPPLATYSNTRATTKNKPHERLSCLFKTLYSAYENNENRRNHWNKVHNVVPKGNGFIIANKYSSLFSPANNKL